MYRNHVSLIGFTGKDAETRTSHKQKSYTILSLATQSSFKDKQSGNYVTQTEWHRIIAWGKLSDFAQKIPKGAHLAVDGALVSYPDKKHPEFNLRIWEVRATSILKLDRAEKVEENLDAEPVDQEVPA